MSTESSIINELAALQVGRIPVWCLQSMAISAGDGPEPCTNDLAGVLMDGTILRNTPRTLVLMSNRRKRGEKHGYFQISVFDIGAAYSLTIDGETVTYDAGAAGALSSSDIYNGLLAAAQANIALATAGYEFSLRENSQGQPVELFWKGPDSMAFTAATVTGAVASVTGFAEVTSFGYQIWATARRGRGPYPPDSTHWFKVGSPVADHETDASRRLDTAGLERLYVQPLGVVLDAAAGAGILGFTYVFVGPSSDEDITRAEE